MQEKKKEAQKFNEEISKEFQELSIQIEKLQEKKKEAQRFDEEISKEFQELSIQLDKICQEIN